LGAAFVLSVLLLVLLGIATALGALPTTGFLCQALCIPCFLSTLLCLRDVQHILRPARETLFLDVLCINQTSADTKRKGIDKLGAFVRYSDTMIILYTDIYLRKLWTVYEIATFLALHPLENLVVLPVFRARVFYCMTVACWMGFNFHAGWGSVSIDTTLCGEVRFKRWAYTGAFVLAMACYFRIWALAKKQMNHSLTAFSVMNCICACETDRTAVEDAIADIMRATAAVTESSSKEEALMAFDNIVRGELPDVLDRVIGKLTFTYEQLAILGIIMHGADAADNLARTSATELAILSYALKCTWRGLFQFPLSLAFLEICVSCALPEKWVLFQSRWSRLWSTRLWNGCVVFLAALLITGFLVWDDHLLDDCLTVPNDIMVLGFLNLTGPLMLHYVFQGMFGQGLKIWLGGIFRGQRQHVHTLPTLRRIDSE